MYEKVFVGRQQELKTIQEVLDRCKKDRVGALINVFGGGGLGKSELLRQGFHLANQLGFSSPGIIDLAITGNQDSLALVSVIAGRLGNEFFPNFQRKLSEHNAIHSEQRPDARRYALDLFISELAIYAQHSPLVLLVDTLESIEGTVTYDWLIGSLVPPLAKSAVVVIVGRNPIDLDVSQIDMLLQPFTIAEILELAQELFHAQGEEFDLDETIIFDIHQKSHGHPIIANLALDWLLWTAEPMSVLSIPAESFEREIALRFTRTGDPRYSEEFSAITHMAILDRRLTDEIYAVVRGLNTEMRRRILERVRQLSFVKYSAEISSYSLHDKMVELIHRHGAIPPEYVASVRRKAVEEFYLPRIQKAEEGMERQTLVIECLHYSTSFDHTSAFSFFVEEYAKAFARFELGFCTRLITTIREVAWHSPESYWIDLFDGELQLKRHSPFAAARLFERVCTAELIIEDQLLMSRAFEGLGKCSIQGCEIAGEDVAMALKHLERAMEICREADDLARGASIEHTMGMAYEMLGDHVSARLHYLRAMDTASELGSLEAASEIADRLTLLLRRTGRVSEALEWAKKSLVWRSELSNLRDLASSYHNLGAVYRDLREKNDGVRNLQTAIDLYAQVGDHMGEAQALKDMGWTFFVFGDNAKANEYAQQSLVLCNRYGFGRIKGEALHTIFEVVDSELGEEASLPLLEEAIIASRDHGGIFMLLDLLMHRVIIDKRTGNCSQIPDRISEIEDYIRRGCQYHYFLGRALVVLGDCALEQGETTTAFEEYHRGYYELALGGESAAFMSSYKKHLEKHLPGVFGKLDATERRKRADDFVSYWNTAGLSQSHPDLPQMCKNY